MGGHSNGLMKGGNPDAQDVDSRGRIDGVEYRVRA